jgi:hypothetical protein
VISKTKAKKIIGYLAFITLLISYKSSNQWSRLPIGNELFWWIIQFVFITILFTLRYNLKKTFDSKNYKFIYAYLFWNVICIIRGTITADNYWEWKTLISTGYMLLLPLLVYICISTSIVQYIIKTWYKYVFFLFLPVLPFLWGDSVGKFLIPFSFLLIFFHLHPLNIYRLSP